MLMTPFLPCNRGTLLSCICSTLAQTGQCSVAWQNDRTFSSNKRNLILSTEHFWLSSKSTKQQPSTSLNMTERDWTRWQNNVTFCFGHLSSACSVQMSICFVRALRTYLIKINSFLGYVFPVLEFLNFLAF